MLSAWSEGDTALATRFLAVTQKTLNGFYVIFKWTLRNKVILPGDFRLAR
jgi:hypothetical protein